MFVTTYKDVVFVEGTHIKAEQIKKVDIEIMGIGAQLRNLKDVKDHLYLKIKESGGNCLVEFTYGQKQRLWAIDNIAFYGSGVVAKLPEDVYQKYFIVEEDED